MRNWKSRVKRGGVWKSSPTAPEGQQALASSDEVATGSERWISRYSDCQGPVGASEERGLSDLQTHTTYKRHATKQGAGSWVGKLWESKQSSDLRQMGQAGAS